MTPITPIKAPALADLENALQLAAVYGDKDVADSDAKQALDRIRGLIACALEQLSEPNEAAIRITARVVYDFDLALHDAENVRREARDTAALILHAAVTGDIPLTWKQS